MKLKRGTLSNKLGAYTDKDFLNMIDHYNRDFDKDDITVMDQFRLLINESNVSEESDD